MEKSVDINSLIDNYIKFQNTDRDSKEYDDLFWVYMDLDYLCSQDPETTWKFILGVLKKDTSNTIMENLSAGLLEDLLSRHGEKMIEIVEKEAENNPVFASLLGGVWQNRMSDEIWKRVQNSWDRSGWDGNTDA